MDTRTSSSSTIDCPHCSGEGVVLGNGYGLFGDDSTTTCPECGGSGAQVVRCDLCKAPGKPVDDEGNVRCHDCLMAENAGESRALWCESLRRGFADLQVVEKFSAMKRAS